MTKAKKSSTEGSSTENKENKSQVMQIEPLFAIVENSLTRRAAIVCMLMVLGTLAYKRIHNLSRYSAECEYYNQQLYKKAQNTIVSVQSKKYLTRHQHEACKEELQMLEDLNKGEEESVAKKVKRAIDAKTDAEKALSDAQAATKAEQDKARNLETEKANIVNEKNALQAKVTELEGQLAATKTELENEKKKNSEAASKNEDEADSTGLRDKFKECEKERINVKKDIGAIKVDLEECRSKCK